jgi:alkylation response protein AidB-like acyl-CoA dehydrogenase
MQNITQTNQGVEDMTSTLSTEHLARLAQNHARDFATRAAEHDLNGSYPFENFQEMQRSGYHFLTIPEELGGLGANIEEFCQAQFFLAQGCASTAMAANMHLMIAGRRADIWRKSRDPNTEAILRRVVNEGITFCAVASDALSGGDPRYSAAQATAVEGGYLLSAQYAFATNSVNATNIEFVFTTSGDNGCTELLSTALPADTPGMTVLNDWDTMGMRGTGSNSVKLKDVFIPSSAITRRRLLGELTLGTLNAHAWFAPSVSACSLGIAQAALDSIVKDIKGRRRIPHQRTMEHFPGSQFQVAEMGIELQTARAMLEKTTHDLSQRLDHTVDDYVQCLVCKIACTRAAQSVVSKALELIGGAGYSRSRPYERYYRDVCSGAFFPQNKFTALELIGKHILNVDWDTQPRFT